MATNRGNIKMIKFFIKDGNLKEWVRIFFVLLGVFFVVLGINLGMTSMSGGIFFVLGFLFAGIGGCASQAHTLKIKPFDNSYKKARESYKKNEGKKED